METVQALQLKSFGARQAELFIEGVLVTALSSDETFFH
jgi:hypothetical protein